MKLLCPYHLDNLTLTMLSTTSLRCHSQFSWCEHVGRMQESARMIPSRYLKKARHWSRTSASGGLSKSEPSCHWSGKPSEPSGDSGSQWLCALERRHSGAGASPMWVNLWVHVSPYDHWVVWCRIMSGQEPEEESESELEEDSSSSFQWLCLTWIEALSQKWTRRRSCQKFLRCEICEAGNLTRNISWSGSQLYKTPSQAPSGCFSRALKAKQLKENSLNMLEMGERCALHCARHIKEASWDTGLFSWCITSLNGLDVWSM